MPFETVSIQAMIKGSSQLGGSMLHVEDNEDSGNEGTKCMPILYSLFKCLFTFDNSLHYYFFSLLHFSSKIVNKWKMVSGKD